MQTYDLPKKLAQQAMREADKALRADHARGIFSEGDPNHPMHNNGISYATGQPVKIFGYNVVEFMGKQYK
jgi:hypothetical protein